VATFSACMLWDSGLDTHIKVQVVLLACGRPSASSGPRSTSQGAQLPRASLERRQLRGELRSHRPPSQPPSNFPWTIGPRPVIRHLPQRPTLATQSFQTWAGLATSPKPVQRPTVLGRSWRPCRVAPCTSTAQGQSLGHRRRPQSSPVPSGNELGLAGLSSLAGIGEQQKASVSPDERSNTGERHTTFLVRLHAADPGHSGQAAGKAAPDLHKSRPEGSLTGAEHAFKELALAKLGRKGLADLD
jgi:hypothetical protein